MLLEIPSPMKNAINYQLVSKFVDICLDNKLEIYIM